MKRSETTSQASNALPSQNSFPLMAGDSTKSQRARSANWVSRDFVQSLGPTARFCHWEWPEAKQFVRQFIEDFAVTVRGQIPLGFTLGE